MTGSLASHAGHASHAASRASCPPIDHTQRASCPGQPSGEGATEQTYVIDHSSEPPAEGFVARYTDGSERFVGSAERFAGPAACLSDDGRDSLYARAMDLKQEAADGIGGSVGDVGGDDAYWMWAVLELERKERFIL